MLDERTAYVIYDGECPFCSEYVRMLRLKEALGPVKLLNAREPHDAVDYVKGRGVDLNQEMALVMAGEVYSGADCMNRLALMSTGAGAFNAITARVFRSPKIARLLYPFLRAGRNLTLKALGRKPIAI